MIQRVIHNFHKVFNSFNSGDIKRFHGIRIFCKLPKAYFFRIRKRNLVYITHIFDCSPKKRGGSQKLPPLRGLTCAALYKVLPKSETMAWPVMARDSSLARNSRILATSLGIHTPTRMSECFAIWPNMSGS